MPLYPDVPGGAGAAAGSPRAQDELLGEQQEAGRRDGGGGEGGGGGLGHTQSQERKHFQEGEAKVLFIAGTNVDRSKINQ